MTIIRHKETNTASTQDWLKASKDMTIRALDSQPGEKKPQGTESAVFTQADMEIALRTVSRKQK